jgi:hypothetical protein
VSAKALYNRVVSILINPRDSVRLDGYYGPAPRRRGQAVELPTLVEL